MRHLLQITCLLLLTFQTKAQQDPFVGTWLLQEQTPAEAGVKMELQVARPEARSLYPAQIEIQYLNFKATYQCLLVKKTNGELAISRNKFAVSEQPYSIGTWTILLNGSLKLTTGSSGTPLLEAKRMLSKRYGIPLPAIINYDETNRPTVLHISDFLKQSVIQLHKTSSIPWRSADASKMWYSHSTPAYFGLVDTLYTKTANATLVFSENNKPDNDTVSVMLNGKMIIAKMDINRPEMSREIVLDTGLNILCFFADNYGRVPPNTSKLNIVFPGKKYTLDFTSKENLSATFMVAKIYYYPDQKQQTPAEITARIAITEKIKLRNTTLIDSITADASEITLALWDDAVEDGDSISLQVNDEIFLPGIAVKKRPQFFKIQLYPGENKIIFIADNLGSISPNTSVLEIIDGKRRKSYMINTNLGQNNAIKISYDYKPAAATANLPWP